MSSLVLRRMSSGRKVWYVYYRDQEGRKRGISTRTTLKKDAIRIQQEIDRNLLQSRFNLEQKIRVSDIFARRLQYLEDQNKSSGTIDRERKVFASFMKYLNSDPKGTPNPQVFEAYKRHRKSDGVSPAGINLELRHLKAAFRWGNKQGFCQQPQIQMLKQERRLPSFLSDDEVRTFLDTIENPLLWLIFNFYLKTGARKEEIASLRWRDIDFEREVVIFRKTKAAQEREVPLHKSIMELLEKMSGEGAEPIFRSIRNPYEPIKSDWIYRQCLIHMDKAGITAREKRGLHVLRHTFASHLIMNGVDITTVSRLLGHSSIHVTVAHYAHLSKRHLEDAIDKLPW